MTSLMAVVDLTSGLVSECSADALSLDLPTTFDVAGPDAALDGVGLLHFGGADGVGTMARSHALPLSTRGAGEEFLVRAGDGERDANGWEVFRRCVREP